MPANVRPESPRTGTRQPQAGWRGWTRCAGSPRSAWCSTTAPRCCCFLPGTSCISGSTSAQYGVFVFFLVSGYIVPGVAGAQGQRAGVLDQPRVPAVPDVRWRLIALAAIAYAHGYGTIRARRAPPADRRPRPGC